jgi:choline dehydrogenase-like flavoprotein
MSDEVTPELSEPAESATPRGFNRRKFIGGAAAGAGVAAFGGLVGSATPARAATVPTTQVTARAVVVGTGFGGGVTALRLGQAGVPTLVLERGLRWPTGPNSNTFATLANLDNRSAWLSPYAPLPGAPAVPLWAPYTGVLEVINGNNMTVNCGACVGGGSIMYHGMTLQPSLTDFVQSMPLAAGLYGELNSKWYPTVASMLGISTIPADILATRPYASSRIFQEHKTITANAVFLNAGSPGTTRLLVKAKGKHLIPNLPAAIGTQWGNNGDRIYEWIGMSQDPGSVQGGPACVGGSDPLSPIPLKIIHAGAPPAALQGQRVMTVVGFGIVPGAGTWAYDATTDDAVLTWPTGADSALQSLIATKVNNLAKAGGGSMIDTNASQNSTWHALGGVPMGSAVDLYGRVLGQRGLYVLDGARIPGSTGACNPSMTIAALAEHSMARIVTQDIGTVF